MSTEQTNGIDHIDHLARTVLSDIAPEADVDGLDPRASIQEALDLDSMDFLNFVTGMYEATGVDIPERDYAQVSTLAGCVEYIAARL